MKTFLRFCVLISCLPAPFAFAAGDSSAATLRFTFDFPKSNPEHYEITLQSDGHTRYSSNGELGNSPNPETAVFEFELSEKTRLELFELAKKANYFSGNVDSGNTRIANMGAKTLAYKDASHDTSANYNYSTDPVVQQITSVFQNLSTVLEYGRRLNWFHKYQKLALEDDLKQMEERQKENTLGDLEAITPLLKQIAADPAVMRITRARAMRLLILAGK